MIEVRNLKKTYKPKKGVKVQALDGIDLKFEDKGLVFILGKSGSGKSTLLNMLGGLDNFDEGEIIIKGKSSKDFTQSDFDSYRNTFIGFIFQEYNILNDFTVGANIALAMELQGHKAESNTLNGILEEVDLAGYAGRKPGELSGGQKQRVAIARALIKNPQIIMADEPTGALDSNTGKQVFDTLKRLSKDKLVIVVSHDRDFAEQYGDRVIELADGRVISDIKKYKAEAKSVSGGVDIIDEKIIHIRPGYQLTEKDMELINDYLKNNRESGSFISLDGKTNTEIRKLARIDEEGSRENFADTCEENLDIREYDASDFKMIKSRLPFKNSVKMAAGSLKKKPFRLFMTILLSMVAFVLFGLTHTMISYERLKSNVDSIMDSSVDYVSFVKKEKRTYGNHYSYYETTNLSDKDIDAIKKEFPDKTFFEVYLPSVVSDGISFRKNLYDAKEIEEAGYYSYYTMFFTGLASVSATDIEQLGYSLEGKMAEHENEVVITRYAAETFLKTGYSGTDSTDKTEIASVSDLIGRTLTLNLGLGEKDYTITGIADTGFDSARYEKYKEPLKSGMSIGDYMLASELEDVTKYSYHALLFIDGSSYRYILENTGLYNIYGNTYGISLFKDINGNEEYLSVSAMLCDSRIPVSEKQNIILFDDDRDINDLSLSEEEIILPVSALEGEESLYAKLKEARKNGNLAGVIKDNKDEIAGKAIKMIMWREGQELTFSQKIAGIYDDMETEQNAAVFSKSVFDKLGIDENARYKTVLSDMPVKRKDITDIVSYSIHSDDGTKRYDLMNSVSSMLDTVSSAIRTTSKVFLVVGIIFAVFASIMLMNFIATSIANKKREIGILRAVGARGTDVFRIFFHESLMIALVNWLISALATGLVVTFINQIIRDKYNLLVTILHFGIIQIAVMLLISLGVAFAASFLPIYRVSRKKPIEAIRKS